MTINAVHKAAMTAYIEAFNAKDLAAILALFNAQAKIYSPTQATPIAPADFYPGLLERSKGTVFTLKNTFAGEQKNTGAFVFDYHKAKADGSVHTFECVDICSFDDSGKITEMRIIFDTKNLGL
ncbi:MAG TPA: nuclear transport factor 2 family protein [Alphaproteobacteria bacterium]|nr:nuclear transport factor 2 family protein [Alphaproteobacteria bacterium]